ncbi:MAG: hypothetical protein ACLGIC_06450 [Acidimicrobiia bacterium]
MITFLLLVVVVVVVGGGALAYRSRPETSIDSGIRAFRREMRALAPPSEQRRLPDDERYEPPAAGPGAR